MKLWMLIAAMLLIGGVPMIVQAGGDVIVVPAAAAKMEPVVVLKEEKEPIMQVSLIEQVEQSVGKKEITVKDREHVLEIINSLDPDLYKAIITVDPTGERHILLHDDFIASNAAIDDGLPVIFIEPGVFEKYPQDLLRAIIAHELGHYVSGHFFENNEPTHSYLFEHDGDEYPTLKKHNNMSGQLPARETFYLSRTRITEYEADRSEILDFGIDIDTAIKAAQILQKEDQEKQIKNPGKKTFKRTHPFWSDRIKQFESLRKEVEVRKARGQKLPKFNWQELAAQYLKKLK